MIPWSASIYANEWFGANVQIAELPTTECPKNTGLFLFRFIGFPFSPLAMFWPGIRCNVSIYPSSVVTACVSQGYPYDLIKSGYMEQN